MKTILKSASLGAVLLVVSPLAFATPIMGTANFLETEHLTSSGVSFLNTLDGDHFPTLTQGGQNDFGFPSVGGFTDYGTPVHFNSLTFATLNGTVAHEELLFTYGTTTFEALSVSTYVATVDAGIHSTPGYLYILGILDVNGVSESASFSLTDLPNSGTHFGGVAYQTGTSVISVPPLGSTPEPSSLILLGTGLASAAGAVLRKRRMMA